MAGIAAGAAADAGGGLVIDALGPAGPYRSRQRRTLTDLSGAAIGEMSLVPALYARRTLAAMRAAPVMPGPERLTAMATAAELFLGGTYGGRGLDEHARLVSTAAGVPLVVVRRALDGIAEVLRTQRDTCELAMPRGAVGDWRDEPTVTGSAVWTRRGDVFAVHAAGNTPGVHGLWPEALALGYKVVVRPSTREPYTAFRLVSALRAAGFPPDVLTFLPSDHAVADILIAESDLAIVYGGQDVVDAHAANPAVLTQGPGRSKILVTADVDWRERIDVIARSVVDLGGTACTCATAVLVEGDPEPVARELARRLGAIPSLPPDDPAAVLSASPLPAAATVDRYLRDVAAGASPLLGGDTVVDELPAGGAVLRPAVHLVDSATAPQLNLELPFPCVWVAPWRPADGVGPLRDSLVLTVLTGRAELVDTLLAEPSIHNVYVGDHLTTWIRPGIPHDGYLADFLMRTKAVIRPAA